MGISPGNYPCARIDTRRELGPFDTVEETYEWNGSLTAPVRIDPHYLRGGLGSLPWPVVCIEQDHWGAFGGLYIRTDVRWWRLTAARYALRRRWRWFTIRAVLTLYVWGLADRDDAAEVSWRQVRWPWRKKR